MFVDRYYFFQGDRPENSYLGFLLQLGGVGLALYLLLLLVAGWVVLRCWRRARAVLREAWVVCLAVLVGGAAIGFFQSFVYSAGNVASLAFWVCVLLPAGTVARGSAGEGSVSAALRWRRRRPTDAA